MTRHKTLTTQLVVRVDPDTRRRLEADAEANGRTLTQTVRFLLTRALDGGIVRLRGRHHSEGEHCACWLNEEKACCGCGYDGDDAVDCTWRATDG